MSVLANASVALALSAHTPRVQTSVPDVTTSYVFRTMMDTRSRHLASASTPVSYHHYCESCLHNTMLQAGCYLCRAFVAKILHFLG